MATPYVTGTVSLMLARNPTLTPGRVLSILQGSAREFPAGHRRARSETSAAPGCSTPGSRSRARRRPARAAAGTITIVEYYDAARDHYLITGDAFEIANLDTDLSRKYVRTGLVFYAYADPFASPWRPRRVPLPRGQSDDRLAFLQRQRRAVQLRRAPMRRRPGRSRASPRSTFRSRTARATVRAARFRCIASTTTGRTSTSATRSTRRRSAPC